MVVVSLELGRPQQSMDNIKHCIFVTYYIVDDNINHTADDFPHKLLISDRKWYFSDKNSYKMDWPDQLLANNGANMQKKSNDLNYWGSRIWNVEDWLKSQ